MFAPKAAKPQAKSAPSPTNTLANDVSRRAAHRLGHDAMDQAQKLQIARDEGQADSAARAAPSKSWDFSKLPVFSPDRPGVRELAVSSEQGEAVKAATRSLAEQQLGHSFASVRVHSDTKSASLAEKLNAAAFTVGEHVVFGSGKYEPSTEAGRHLILHELAHVVQQRQASGLSPEIGASDDVLERRAERAAAGGPLASAVGLKVPAVQRQTTGLPDKTPAGTASRDEVLAALTAFLEKARAAEGTQDLRVTAPVRQALQILAGDDSGVRLRVDLFLSNTAFPSTPAGFAREALTHLPPVIPRSRLEHLDAIPPKEEKDTRPASVGEALATATFEGTVVKLVKALKLSEDLQKTIIEAARSAVSAGIAGLADLAMKNSQISDPAQKAIHNAIAQLIDQKKNTPANVGGQAAATGSPNVQQPPPSAGPPQIQPIPGEQIFNAPKLNIPEPGGSKPQSRPAPSPASPQSLEQAIAGIDKNALVPPEARGKSDAAGRFDVDAQDFARDVARQLDAAQKARRFTVELTLSADYRDAQDVPAIFDEAAGIVQKVANALPHHASEVGQVIVQIAARKADEPSHLRRVIRLHGAP